MEPDGRLVEHVQGARETAPELAGESDALRLSARKRRRRTIEREIIETDVQHEGETCINLFQNRGGDIKLHLRQFNGIHEVLRLADGHICEVHDTFPKRFLILTLEVHTKRLGAQAFALADWACLFRKERFSAEAVTLGARAVGRVERKKARLNLRER